MTESYTQKENAILRRIVREQAAIIEGILECLPDEFKNLENVKRALASCKKVTASLDEYVQSQD